ncbi:MAG: PspA-associated protein PspAA [Trebonia sp.]
MIVRILGEGQFELDEAQAKVLASLDAELTATVDRGDEAGFKKALTAAVTTVRSVGSVVPHDSLAASEVILPSPDASLDEVRKLLADDGVTLG